MCRCFLLNKKAAPKGAAGFLYSGGYLDFAATSSMGVLSAQRICSSASALREIDALENPHIAEITHGELSLIHI